jgi:hypothetical protein
MTATILEFPISRWPRLHPRPYSIDVEFTKLFPYAAYATDPHTRLALAESDRKTQLHLSSTSSYLYDVNRHVALINLINHIKGAL